MNPKRRPLIVLACSCAIGLAFGVLAELHWISVVNRQNEASGVLLPVQFTDPSRIWIFPIGFAMVFGVLGTIAYFCYHWIAGKIR